MKIKQLCIILSPCLIFSCIENEKLNEDIIFSKPETTKNIKSIVPGKLMVKFSEELIPFLEDNNVTYSKNKVITASDEINQVFDEVGVKSLERLFPYAGKFEERTRAEGLHRWYKLNVNEKKTYSSAEHSLKKIKGIEIVEPKREIKSQIFNDKLFSFEWFFFNRGKVPKKLDELGEKKTYVEGVDINILPVWKCYCKGNSDIIIAVVDEGVELSHEDLQTACIPGGPGGSKNFVDASTTPYVIVPGDHGTHVAGVIAAINNNNKGISSVAGGDSLENKPGVRILSCQIMKTKPETDQVEAGDELAAIKWGADNGAVISQNSWGYKYKTEEEAKNDITPQAFKDAVDYFIKYAGVDEHGQQFGPMNGGIVIFAAGNDNFEFAHPCDYDKVLTVGAIDPDGKKAPYSNYGSWVDISAPGTNITSTITKNRYGVLSGTSMAAPLVSGVAALIIDYFGGPGFTPDKLRDKLCGGAKKTPLLQGAQIGDALDALGAMLYGISTPPPAKVDEFDLSAEKNAITCTWSIKASSTGKKPYSYIIMVSTDSLSIVNSNPETVLNSTAGIMAQEYIIPWDKEVGHKLELTKEALKYEQKYFLGLYAAEYNKKYSDLSPIKSIFTGTKRSEGEFCDVYPNVFKEYVFLRGGKGKEQFNVKIVSQTGVLYYEKEVEASYNNPAKINVAFLPPGTYICDVSLSESKRDKKIIIKY